MGYDALEVAPFTLADDPTTLDAAAAREVRHTVHAHGLQVSSLHWLLVKPEGLSLVTDDAALRRRTLDLLRRLIDFAAACGRRCWCTDRPDNARHCRPRRRRSR